MGVILEIRSGPLTGKMIALKKGQSVTVGRAAGKAQFALEQDTFLSGLHFAVECTASGCRVVDRKSSNGTFLNGAKIKDAMLANGDEIKAGQTAFHVKIVADEKLAGMTMQQLVAPAASRPAQSDKPPAPLGEAERPVRPRSSDPPARVSEPRPERPSEKELPGTPGPLREREPARPLASETPSRPEVHVEKLSPVEEAPPNYDVRVKAEAPARIDAPGAEPPPKSRDNFWAAPEAEKASLANAQKGREIASRPVDFEKVAGAGVRPSGPRAPAAASSLGRDTPPRRGTAAASAFRVMGWSFPLAPNGWSVQEGFGLQSSQPQEEFPSSVAATEEGLAGITLQQFVESQIGMLRGYLRDARIEPIIPPRIDGADESMGVDVRHSTKDGTELAYRHVYARSGSSVGVLTVTTLASQFPSVMENLKPLLDGASFRSTSATS